MQHRMQRLGTDEAIVGVEGGPHGFALPGISLHDFNRSEVREGQGAVAGDTSRHGY